MTAPAPRDARRLLLHLRRPLRARRLCTVVVTVAG